MACKNETSLKAHFTLNLEFKENFILLHVSFITILLSASSFSLLKDLNHGVRSSWGYPLLNIDDIIVLYHNQLPNHIWQF